MSNLLNLYKQNDSIVARQIGDEVILVPIKNDCGDLDSIYTLNDVAAFIWHYLDGTNSVEKIRDLIVHAYDVDQEEAEKDLLECLESLLAVQAVEIL